MNVNEDLVGKTITGLIASPSQGSNLREIWVIQFADGSHVEFVSPGARKALRCAANQSRAPDRTKGSQHATRRVSEQPAKVSGRFANSGSMHYQRELETGVQLTLNVA